MYKLLDDEEKYYKDYQWCIDPMPCWGELRTRFVDELEHWSKYQEGWQERETALNCWLMAGALWQTCSDHLVRGNPSFIRLVQYLYPLRRILVTVQRYADTFVRLLNRTCDRSLMKTDAEWRELVLELSRNNLTEAVAAPAARERIRVMARSLLEKQYPLRLCATRIHIPSAFYSQDLTHFDVIRLLKNYTEETTDYRVPLLVVGVRTTGSYFAPLAQAYLESVGFASVRCTTMRPGRGLSCNEHEELSRHARDAAARFLLIDEPARTGSTVKEALGILRSYGVANERIAIAFPIYPAHTRWKQNLLTQDLKGTKVYTLSWCYWHQSAKMNPEHIRKLLKEYFDAQEMCLVNVEESPKGRSLDERFGQMERIGWRLKQVYRVRYWDRRGTEHSEDILAKSVGWGWFGYHAYIEADRLREYVPPVVGLRSGFLFMKWIDGTTGEVPATNIGKIMPQVMKYIFERIDKLSLSEDVTFKECARRNYGGELLCSLLCRAYGRRLGNIMRPVIRRVLRRYATMIPTVIDGKMSPREWVYKNGRFWKTDYEHHCFGQVQLNITDPVFDLASFIFEFRLDQKDMDEAIRCYVDHTNDRLVRDKVVLYVWLIAHHDISNVKEYLSEPYRYKWSLRENMKYLNDRQYISRFFMEYFSRMVKWVRRKAHRHCCLVLDIDFMMNRQLWEFPIMTLQGIRNIAQLHGQGYRLFIRSARSLPEVRDYCNLFGIDGALAENGSVLWCRTEQREIPLIERDAAGQVRKLAALLLDCPSVYVDSHYRYIVKAFHYRGRSTTAVDPGLIENILVQNRLNALTVLHQNTGTVVTARVLRADTEGCIRSFFPSVERIMVFNERQGGVAHRNEPAVPLPILAPPAGQTRRTKKNHATGQSCPGRARNLLPRMPDTRPVKPQLLITIMGIAERPKWGRLLSVLGTRTIV
jgi:hypothetical protein